MTNSTVTWSADRSQIRLQSGTTTATTGKSYSLAQIQLTNGEVIAMTISAAPTLGAHLAKEMSQTGQLYLYNDNESLIIKADRIAAVKLTKLTQE